MEIAKVIFAPEETISDLRRSQPSSRASMPGKEMIRRLETEAVKARNAKMIDIHVLARFFAPTGLIQQLSIDNGWKKVPAYFRSSRSIPSRRSFLYGT